MSAELRRRNLILVAVISIVSGAYALSFSSFSPASAVAVALGAQANNVAMLCAVLPWMLFLAALLPEDLDAAEARGSIGVLLMVSNFSSIYVFWCIVQAYSADRAAAASTDYNRWMCLHIHYGLCVFFVVCAVLVPTAHFLRLGRLRMSWAVCVRQCRSVSMTMSSKAYSVLHSSHDSSSKVHTVLSILCLVFHPRQCTCNDVTDVTEIGRKLPSLPTAASLLRTSVDGLQRNQKRKKQWRPDPPCAAALLSESVRSASTTSTPLF